MMPLDALLSTEISLRHLTLLEVVVPRKTFFRSSIGVRRQRQALFVHWTDRDDDWGVGECSCRPDPYYNGEFVDGAIGVLRDFVFPSLLARGTVREVVAAASKVRGWNFTVAALLEAVFDLLRRKGLPDVLDAWPVAPLPRVPVGISLPLFDTADEAAERVEQAVAAGYRRVKLKVAPGMNLDTLAAVRSAFPSIYLGFDANGACTDEDRSFVDALAAFEPAILEQPFAPDRLDLCVALRKHRPALKVCLDESISGLGDLMTAHRLGALDELNLKPGRVGGPLATLRILDYCAAHALPVWVGGMFETGLGRAANLRVAARLPEAKAHDLRPAQHYLTADVVEQPLAMDTEGYVHVDDRPVMLNDAVIDRFCTRRIVLAK
ncbi:MAG: enolase C-terminal domain-like protein [Rhodothermales bacterium]